VVDVVVTFVNVPHVAPEQPLPESDHVTPLFCESFCTVAAKPAVVKTCTDVDVGLTPTEIGSGAAVTVMVADADFVESATEVAFSVTVAGVGTAEGAVYVTEVLVTFASVPHVAPEQPLPESDHVTPLFCESFCTVAVKPAVVKTCTGVDVGLTETEIGAGAAVTVMVADADFVPSATDVAFSVTVAGVGTAEGAVYVTEVLVTFVSVPHVAPEQPLPESDHVTPLFCESFCTVAMKPAVAETCTDVDVGLRPTEMGAGAAVTVIVVDADFVESATEVAFSVTVAGAGTAAGAVYVTEVVVTFVNVPHAAPEQPVPETNHVTPWFCESFCTVAMKFAEVDTWMDSDVGLTETEIDGGSAVMVMVVVADFDASATEVAVRMTVGEVGTEGGA